ncbi:hypothetical protein [Hymenobacter radiodurans]|uniref:hypothetical protein n=1 Tax=Hymenobacter radiodurans TaxID=2496028 RepID=UPI001058F16A|nr:hypothetical protein [Hymenobacter radiodurans]
MLLYTSFIAASIACEKEDDLSQECVSVTILGTTCEGATLLQLDTAVPIGSSVYFSGDMGDPTPGTPAVAATYANVVKTFTPLPTLYRGEAQWFFKLRLASSEERIERFCTANKIWYDAPQVIVTDSSTVCRSSRSK